MTSGSRKNPLLQRTVEEPAKHSLEEAGQILLIKRETGIAESKLLQLASNRVVGRQEESWRERDLLNLLWSHNRRNPHPQVLNREVTWVHYGSCT